jgi:hypothetical protein
VYTLKPQPVQELADWLAEVSQLWQVQLDSFKDYVALRSARPK